MKIKLIANNQSHEILEVIHQIESLGMEAVYDNDNIDFNGRTINMGVYEQLKSRDRKNPQTIALHKLVIQRQIEKIKECDAVLVLNKAQSYIIPEFGFEIIVAYLNQKPIFSYDAITMACPSYDLMSCFGIIYLYGNMDKLKESLQLLERVKSVLEVIPTACTKKPSRLTLKTE